MPGAFKRLENEKPQSTHKPHADIKDIEDRHCTDVCCLLLFVVMWIGLLSIGIFSFFNGDLASIEYGSDYMGNRCGMGNFSDRPVVWYPRFARDVAEQAGVLAKHPTAKAWIDFPDMALYRMNVLDLYWVGGFGNEHYIGYVGGSSYLRSGGACARVRW